MENYNILPIGKRVIVKRKAKDAGAFHLSPELEREGHPDCGLCVAVGKIGWWNKYVRGIKVGAEIYYTQYSPVRIKDDERIMFVELQSILGKKIKPTTNKTID